MEWLFLIPGIAGSLVQMCVLLFFHDELLIGDPYDSPERITCLTAELETAKRELDALRGDHGD